LPATSAPSFTPGIAATASTAFFALSMRPWIAFAAASIALLIVLNTLTRALKAPVSAPVTMPARSSIWVNSVRTAVAEQAEQRVDEVARDLEQAEHRSPR
jgi:hypothetical protein